MPLLASSTHSALNALLSIACIVLSLGCSSEKNAVETFPVSGTVLYKNQPAAGAKVLFFFTDVKMQEKRLPMPQATVNENGSFQVSCFGDADGAPEGEYRIALVWRREPKAETKGDFRPPDRLEGRYADPLRTGLTATVIKGNNILPTIHLK